MNDTTIISAISTLHRAIVSLALFIFIVGSSSYFLLKDGVLINEITLGGLDVEKLYIKWDEKLTLYAKHAYVTKSSNKESAHFDYRSISKAFGYIKFFEGFVGSVSIEKLRLGDAEGAFHYNVGSDNVLTLSAPDHALHCHIDFGDDYFVLNVDEYRNATRNVNLSGVVVARLHDSEFYARLDPTVASVEGLHLYAYANHNALTFSATADKPLTDIAPLVDLFGLPDNIRKWIVDYGKGSSVTLNALHGTLPYRKPERLLQNLYGEATYYDLAYTFNQHVDPIRTKSTQLRFEKGVLNILPNASRFYKHDGGKSWLKIDFNSHPITLTAYVRTETTLDRDLLNLLESYKIHLPFIQTVGTTKADLTLAVTLANGHTDALGDFMIDRGVYRFQGVDFNVTNAHVGLHGADITIDTLNMAQNGHINTAISGQMNPVRKEGRLKIVADSVSLGSPQNPLTLDQEHPLHLEYILGSKSDTVVFEPSKWRIGSNAFNLEAMQIPFDFSSGVATLKNIPIQYGDTARAKLSGRIALFDAEADLEADLTRLRLGTITLDQPNLPLALRYNGIWHLDAPKASRWDVNGTRFHIGAASMEVNGSRLQLFDTPFEVPAHAKGVVNATYEHDTQTALLGVSKLQLQHEGIGTYFASHKPLRAMVHHIGERIYAASDDLDFAFSADAMQWDLSLNSLATLAKYSTALRRYDLEKGEVQVGHKKGFESYAFSGILYYPQAIIVNGDTPTGDFAFKGNYSLGRLNVNLNDSLYIDIGDKITIASEGIGYNLGAILKVLNAHGGGNTDVSSLPDISFNATDSFIYFTPERRAVADLIRFYTSDNGLYGRLNHQEGVAILELKDGDFFLYGNRFGDLFMRHLLSLAEYRGGLMSFHVNGTTEEAHGVVRVQETTVKDYKTLNNILAFINTVPSLATFSLPHYSDKGLDVNDAYASFQYKDRLVTIDGVKVDSPELDITGSGVIDYINENVDMQLNLITDAGTNVSKVPLVGYILVGDKGDITTTLKITGNMNDPKVSTGIAKGIVVAPFKMIMRTLTLPFNIFKKGDKSEEEKKE